MTLLDKIDTRKYNLKVGIEYYVTYNNVTNRMKLIKIIDLSTCEDWACIFECPKKQFIDCDKFEQYEIENETNTLWGPEAEFAKCDVEYEQRKNDYVWVHLNYSICCGDMIDKFTISEQNSSDTLSKITTWVTELFNKK